MKLNRICREFLKTFSELFWDTLILYLCDGLHYFVISVIQMGFSVFYYWFLERLFDMIKKDN